MAGLEAGLEGLGLSSDERGTERPSFINNATRRRLCEGGSESD